MPESYQDSYSISFHRLSDMMDYHINQSLCSRWERVATNDLYVEPLDEYSPLSEDITAFELSVSGGAVKDTVKNLGLALRFGAGCFPMLPAFKRRCPALPKYGPNRKRFTASLSLKHARCSRRPRRRAWTRRYWYHIIRW